MVTDLTQLFKGEGLMPVGDCGRVLQPVGEASVKQTACLSPKGEFAVCQKRALQTLYEGT